MHDFCFTIPYGLIMVVGGLIGYLKKGSTVSLAGGLGTGSLLLLAGYVSLKSFGKRRNSYFSLFLETGCAFTVTYVMGQRYIQTSKIMPAGIVAAISAFMAGFYVYKIASGGNHFSSESESKSK
ncbi:protein FATTY ACID EXPORT 5-like [Macadamia integrifolia]|uniref:protein FATTY ACID EXPORT 5-like n=1 Tax=Macadamia integrifolia TaxID=60698 RepID=UPI001C530829|nr:protein FATTY ACID EXPORT 5-like [Macadamia integrifolia]